MKQKFQKVEGTIREAWGLNDGINSATFKNPIHNNWKGTDGILRHFDKEYISGYIKGYHEVTGITLTINIVEA